MKQEVNSIEEARAIVDPLMEEKKWAITVLEQVGGTFVVQWIEHKKYTAQDGQEFLDEVWTTEDGTMRLIQDLDPEHARNVLRMILRKEREYKNSMEALRQLAETLLGGDLEDAFTDEEEEPLFPDWDPGKPAGTLH